MHRGDGRQHRGDKARHDGAGAIDDTQEPEWELFDLDQDPYELNNVYDDPAYAQVVQELKHKLYRLQEAVGDEPYAAPSGIGQVHQD